jgi:hypothetical protein
VGKKEGIFEGGGEGEGDFRCRWIGFAATGCLRGMEGAVRGLCSGSESEPDDDSDEESEDDSSCTTGFTMTFFVMGMVSFSLSESDEDDDDEDSDAARLFRFLFRFLGATGFAGGGGIAGRWKDKKFELEENLKIYRTWYFAHNLGLGVSTRIRDQGVAFLLSDRPPSPRLLLHTTRATFHNHVRKDSWYPWWAYVPFFSLYNNGSHFSFRLSQLWFN